MRVVFSHGLAGTPWGTKIAAMAERARALGCEADSVDYRHMFEPAARVTKLSAHLDGQDPDGLALVGSSMGAYVAARVAPDVRPRGLFLLAPALAVSDWPPVAPPPEGCVTELVHGWDDDVVPVEHSVQFARDWRAGLHVVADGHRLQAALPQVVELFAGWLGRL